MSNKDFPAFPIPAVYNQAMCMHTQEYGMGLRDYFAAKILSTLIQGYLDGNVPEEKIDAFTLQVAKYAYRFANAMLLAREEPEC